MLRLIHTQDHLIYTQNRHNWMNMVVEITRVHHQSVHGDHVLQQSIWKMKIYLLKVAAVIDIQDIMEHHVSKHLLFHSKVLIKKKTVRQNSNCLNKLVHT